MKMLAKFNVLRKIDAAVRQKPAINLMFVLKQQQNKRLTFLKQRPKLAAMNSMDILFFTFALPGTLPQRPGPR
ncbi:hypothetical protein INH39_28735 [Massilia violaceinigra]|uniref:Uncharacterized protein n=1 Tax=Massilia violaceinigra TaxID=2045208 RepID=A0ABY4A3Y5_9BURK|nr:hypothetical protein [Massilia violaceinigra]UOD29352.1 hypothetical protein INH39_28735 [Massilia violaceinigra]